jgi:putative ABC transport system ATP-binding protein
MKSLAVKVHALKGVSLKVKKGEFLAIIGKSGSGKSTIMNLIGCLDTPSEGYIKLDSRNTSDLAESELAQIRGKKIGFVFQQFNLIPTLSALENVALPGEFQDGDTEELHRKAKKLLSFVEMEERMDHKPTELSGGQMQRVAIARALINDPELLLADEPTGALDSKTGVAVMQLLKDLNLKKKKSIVLVTHDKSLVKHADRVIELVDGKVHKEYTNGRRSMVKL